MMPPTRTSERRSATFDMYRNAELDVYEEMRAEGRQTPTKPTIPPLAVKLGVFSDVENRYDEFVAAYVQDNVLEVARHATSLVRDLVQLCIAYGIPFSDVWDEQREAFGGQYPPNIARVLKHGLEDAE